jgi:EAL domain-containing protein (putative c-di-GMP-specific phosphodiesterase class I)
MLKTVYTSDISTSAPAPVRALPVTFGQRDLAGAADRGELRLVYQPLARLSSGKTIGYEALLRWDHPELGTIMPTDFIEDAEDSGEIVAVGEWVMRQACNEAALWDSRLFVSVNVSPVQIESAGFVDMVVSALAESGLNPVRLEVEVTETALIRNGALTSLVLRQLRNMGVRIALDDFGAGHASFAYLLNFPFDKIKVDRQFVCDIAHRAESRAIVEAVATLAHKLGMEVLAEGIEDVDQLIGAKLAGCELGQGHLLGQPRAAADHYNLRRGVPASAARQLMAA